MKKWVSAHGLLALIAGMCLVSTGLAVVADQVSDERYVLDLGGVRFDPLADTPAFPPALAHLPSREGHDLHLVQFQGPIKDAQIDSITRNGLEIVQYIHP